jgi:Xaa-Pro aminopeptidase
MSNGSGEVARGGDPKLESLRAALAEVVHGLGKGVDAYIIPSEDAHMSEYAPKCDNRRAFISGFTGSAGCAAVTSNSAALWTDGRYFLQVCAPLAGSQYPSLSIALKLVRDMLLSSKIIVF